MHTRTTRRIIGLPYSLLLLAATGCLALTPRPSHAQVGFFSSFGSSITDARMNVQIQELVVEPAPPQDTADFEAAAAMSEAEPPAGPRGLKAAAAPSQKAGQASKPEPFVTAKELAVAYSYLFKRETASSHLETSVHAFVPELFLQTRSGLAIRPSLLYFGTDTETRGSSFAQADAFGGGLALSQELLHPFHPRDATVNPPRWELSANVEIGYRDTNVDLAPALGGSSSDYQSLSAGSGVTLMYHAVQPTDGYVNLSITPTFRYEEKRVVVSSEPPGEAELLAVEGRIDVKVAAWLVVIAKVSWFHDLLLTIPSVPDPENEDWAEFSVAAIAVLSPNVQLRTAVNYEAFHSDYYSVRVAEQIAYTF